MMKADQSPPLDYKSIKTTQETKGLPMAIIYWRRKIVLMIKQEKKYNNRYLMNMSYQLAKEILHLLGPKISFNL
ncbi:hypothetical protein FGO68_gene15147 [Halteria grandinella]|uniref:Uncharacterized protein n=1 Tax=Halteria grandinella TaxID=5974 RepID=A0A8J8P108_HALGN|nr:hypothetical protein FGO68_gene15147 [Halteria grandinella]